MCQPKAQGGKRCLKHAAASKFTVRVTTVKTGVDTTTVEKTLSDLNKEGKKLPTPETAEVQQWLETKRFATEYDPELSEHERKIQTNQLNRAGEEVEQGVTGGQFHAWKNVLNTVRENLGRKVAAAGLITAMTFSLAGCFASDTPDTNEPTRPGTSLSAEYGDAAGLGEERTDDLGSYEPLTIGDNASAAVLDPGTVSPGVYEAGYTDEEIQAAQLYSSRLVVEQFLDSSALDTGAAGYQNWYDANAQTYFNEQVATDLAPGGAGSTLILNNSGQALVPQLVRDGSPRASYITVTVDSISTEQQSDGSNFLVFEYSYDASYRATDTGILQMATQNTGLNENELRDILKPEVFDGQGENAHGAYGSVKLGVVRQGENFLTVGASAYHYFDQSGYANQ